MPEETTNQPASRYWTYNQRTGQLRNPDGVLYEKRGYSGADATPDDKIVYKNKPEFEHVENKGVIPRGVYIIGQATRRKGPLTLKLKPEGHKALGRTYLRIHGDSKDNPGKASQGCIILSKEQRQEIHSSRDRRLKVVDEPEWQ